MGAEGAIEGSAGVIVLAAADVERAIRILKALPEAKVRAASYFLEFLAASDEEAQATVDVLEDADLLAAVRRAEEARREGRQEEFVPWRAVRSGV